jgi:hypothetical protein
VPTKPEESRTRVMLGRRLLGVTTDVVIVWDRKSSILDFCGEKVGERGKAEKRGENDTKTLAFKMVIGSASHLATAWYVLDMIFGDAALQR